MSNIYEALEQAQREKAGSEIPSLISLPEESPVIRELPARSIPFGSRKTAKSAVVSMDAEMFSLHQNIDYLLPDRPEKTILFMGPQGGEGVSTIVREFGMMAAAKLNKRVLIMDAAHHNPTQHIYFDIKVGFGWKDVMKSGEPAAKACYGVGAENLFLSPVSLQSYDHPAAAGFLEELKSKFDLILIDSSPGTTSPDSMAISRFTDGVVLVVESERTRWQVIESVKDKLARNGGNVLGLVFNKRRYHIPAFIYKLLY